MNETLAWWAEVGVVVLGAHRAGPRRLRMELAFGHQTVDPELCFFQECTADGRMLWRGCGCGCQKDLPPLQISPHPTLLPLLPPPPSALLPPEVCTSPHMVPVGGAPSPQIPPFLHRRTFVWGLDGEQGIIEWLAEDWGHWEGQDQERGGFYSATSWTPDDPQHYGGGGGVEPQRHQARKRLLLWVWIGELKGTQGQGSGG